MKNSYLLIAVYFLFNTDSVDAQTYLSNNISMFSNWYDPACLPEPNYGIKYNGIWGYADPQGNEYAIVGSTAGTYFVNVTNPTMPVLRDFVESRRDSCVWHEIKTYQNYCYIVSDDLPPNSLQIVDMSYLPDSVHVVYDSDSLFATSHTIFIDGNKLYGGYVRGGSIGQSAMAVFDLTNPASPVLLRKVEDDYPGIFAYAHDMYVRNDTIYASCGFNGLFIFVLDANNHFVQVGSITTYFNQGYNHSSALSDDGHTLIFCEELSTAWTGGQPVRSVDVTDFGNMTILNSFQSHVGATAHNPFIKGKYCFIAYYQDGLQLYDISDPANPVNVGYFDTHWQNDSASNYYPAPDDAGAWGAYPWLPSGNVIVSDMQNGLFVLNVYAITGVKDNSMADKIGIYPNPVNGDLLNVKMDAANTHQVNYELSNAQGQYLQKNILLNHSIDIKNLSSGVYTLRLMNENTIAIKKFVKIK